MLRKTLSVFSILFFSTQLITLAAHADDGTTWVNPTFQKVMDVLTSDQSQSLVMNVVVDDGQFAGLRFVDVDDQMNHDSTLDELTQGKVVTQKMGYAILTVYMDYKNSGTIKFYYTRNVLTGSQGVISGMVAYDAQTKLYRMEDANGTPVTTAMINVGNFGIRSIELH